MRQKVQWYLAEALANARATMGLPDALSRREVLVAGFSGSLGALRYVDELTVDEEREWRNRMFEAVGIEPPQAPQPGVLRAVFVGDPSRSPSPARRPTEPSRFVRSVSGPDHEYDLLGGRLRIIAVDIYDSALTVRWRVAPEPEIAAVFPAEEGQLLRDIEGTEGWAAVELQKKAHERLRMRRLYRFTLTDDVGTQYVHSGGGSSGRPNEMTGEARFSPSPPSSASELILGWLDLSIAVPLATG